MSLQFQQKQVDLDELLREFGTWQKHLRDLCQENQQLTDENTLISKQLDAARKHEASTLRDIRQTRDIIDGLHNIMKTQRDFEDKNKNLESNISSLTDDIEQLEKAQEECKAEMSRNISDMKVAHKLELDQLRSSILANEEKEKQILRQTISESKRQVDELEKRFEDAEKAKQEQLVKLRLQCDAKLLKMQKLNTKNQQSSTQMPGATQDIFRKKLLHVQAESESQITNLKQQLKDAQQKLASAQSSPSTGMSFKRRRF